MDRPESTLAVILMSECVFFSDLSSFFDFCFSVLFFDAEKYATALHRSVSSRPCHPLKDMRQHGIKSGIKPLGP